MIHSSDNPDSLIKEYYRILKKDSFLIADFVMENSFSEINYCMSIIENEREGGISPNIHIFPSFQSLGNSLNKYNFNLSSFSINKYLNYFRNSADVFEYLKQIGETNVLNTKRYFKSKSSIIGLLSFYNYKYSLKKLRNEENFQEYNKYIKTDFSVFNNYNLNDLNTIDKVKYNTERILINESKDFFDTSKVYSTFSIASFISWKEDKLKQPLERGSAEINLKDIFSEATNDDNIRYGFIEPKNKGNSNENTNNNDEEYEIKDYTDKIKEIIENKKKNRK